MELTRRRLLKGVAATLTAPVVVRSRQRVERPNLLVIASDQQHFQAAGFVDPFFSTPALDALAASATVFPLAFCPAPVCSPSRAALLTGQYPHRTGMLSNLNEPGGEPLDQPTIGHFLQAAGYRTAFLGKWHLGSAPGAQGGWDVEHKVVSDEGVVRRALAFLQAAANEERPWALFLMFLDPHDVTQFKLGESVPSDGSEPLDESWEKETFEGKPAPQLHYARHDEGAVLHEHPAADWKRYRALYRSRMAALDVGLAKVLDALRSTELAERTAVVFTSDHGEMDTRHKLVFKGPFMYEQLVRVPLIVRLPERFGGRAPGRVEEHAWVHVDLVPTLLELARAEVRAGDGRSVVPFLRGETAEPRRSVFIEYHGKKRWLCPIRTLRTEGHKYSVYLGHGEELYDLVRDPFELVNLAGAEEHAARKTELRAELDAWIEASADPFYSLEVSELRTFDRRTR